MNGETRVWLANLLLPGAGLVMLDRPAGGLVVGLVFAAVANAAIVMTLLFPDDFSPTWRGLSIGAVGGIYFGAQLRLSGLWRQQSRIRQAARRSAALAEATAALDAGDGERALAALTPLIDESPEDLIAAYRLAQAHTLRGDADAGLAAWRRVRALDRHRLYREFIERGEQALTADTSDSRN